MCNKACLDFGEKYLTAGDIAGSRVLEVGSRDVNGSLRQIVAELGPREYVGVDIEIGPGVDEVCDVFELANRFGKESFDVVMSTEMIEHVLDWRAAISELKQVVKPGGVLLITTRSKGFPYHDYPSDYWRFEISDMQRIFADMKIEALEPDTSDPGVLLLARKPAGFVETDLAGEALYSMITEKRSLRLGTLDVLSFKFRKFLKS